jgi:3-methyladenine DNA glycosylase AlkC
MKGQGSAAHGTPTRRSVDHESLDQGTAESRTLADCLAVDQTRLIREALPDAGESALRTVDAAAGSGILRRMQVMGTVLSARYGLDEGLDRCGGHASDTVRGWACFIVGASPDLDLPTRLERIAPLADDAHFGVREWAWLALREHLAKDVARGIALLVPWTAVASERLRRFASEALRPRGVWCPHIPSLKKDPSPGLALLQPLNADPSPYVQDSVANWLNDAGKSSPEWVRAVVDGWQQGQASIATRRICARALRRLPP